MKIVDTQGGVIESALRTHYPAQYQAVFENNVSYRSKNATFYTSKHIYDVEKQQSKFLQGEKLVEGEIVLTSSIGLYDGAIKLLFRKRWHWWILHIGSNATSYITIQNEKALIFRELPKLSIRMTS